MNANEVLKPSEVQLMPQAESALTGGFFKIVHGSTALALGCMTAAVEALRKDVSGFTFHVSSGTFVAFAVGLAGGLIFWKMAARSLFAVRVGAALLVLAGIGGFLYPLRFVPSDKMAEITIGLSFAVCALSTGACMLWSLKRFFDADAATVEAKEVGGSKPS